MIRLLFVLLVALSASADALRFPVCQNGVGDASGASWLKSAVVEWKFKRHTPTDPTRSTISVNVCSTESRGLSLEGVTHIKFEKRSKATGAAVAPAKTFPICYKTQRRACLDNLRRTGCLAMPEEFHSVSITDEFPVHENRAASADEYVISLVARSDDANTSHDVLKFCA